MIQYHDTLDVSLIEMETGSKPKVMFVTVPPFKQTVPYKQVMSMIGVGATVPILEMHISGPTEDVPQYHGYVTFGRPVNQSPSLLDISGQEQSNEDIQLLLRFTESEPAVDDTMIAFPLVNCWVDIFDDRRLYFTADSNIIKTRGRKFDNGSAAGGTQNG